ncbi:MAG: hypothetical protein K6G54_00505 [Oscillospiraceae bacterium]|nr:hypothetical protein [Oscillospiraceae bacterium]
MARKKEAPADEVVDEVPKTAEPDSMSEQVTEENLPLVDETEEVYEDAPTDTEAEDVSVPDEYPEELAAQEAPTPELDERQRFFATRFRELDRGLTPAERAEWDAIYASYRGRSVMHGTVIGIDPLKATVYDPAKRTQVQRTTLCAVIVRHRVRIFIPESELWFSENEKPGFVTESITGARLDFIITKVDREGEYAVASRRMALRARRYYFTHRPALCTVGARISCKMLSVGARNCLVECYGYDVNLRQRDIRYTAIPDLRREYHPGMELPCIFKGFDPKTRRPVISIKETEANPFDGAAQRHPVGCRRLAVISGKYGGGVFCNLPDGTVLMCDYSYQHEDGDFLNGDTVILVVQRYNMEKKQIYGKILSKW